MTASALGTDLFLSWNDRKTKPPRDARTKIAMINVSVICVPLSYSKQEAATASSSEPDHTLSSNWGSVSILTFSQVGWAKLVCYPINFQKTNLVADPGRQDQIHSVSCIVPSTSASTALRFIVSRPFRV